MFEHLTKWSSEVLMRSRQNMKRDLPKFSRMILGCNLFSVEKEVEEEIERSSETSKQLIFKF